MKDRFKPYSPSKQEAKPGMGIEIIDKNKAIQVGSFIISALRRNPDNLDKVAAAIEGRPYAEVFKQYESIINFYNPNKSSVLFRVIYGTPCKESSEEPHWSKRTSEKEEKSRAEHPIIVGPGRAQAKKLPKSR